MKKYIIKNADGSEQDEIQNSHNSRNGASEALMEYLYEHNEYLGIGDEDYLSPFDFKIEEVECNEVNEVITNFESARKVLAGKPNTDFYVVKRKHSEKVTNLEDAAILSAEGAVELNPLVKDHKQELERLAHEEEQASQNQRDLFGLNQTKEDIYGGAE